MTTTLSGPDYIPGETFENHLRRHGCVLHPDEWDAIVSHHEIAETSDPRPAKPLPAPVPVTGVNAWFVSIEDRETVFFVPVTCLLPSWMSYSGHPEEELHLEWDPAIISANGFLTELSDNATMPAMHRGVLIGCAPASLDKAAALAHLEHMTVAGPGEDDIGHYTAAQMRLDGRLPFAERTAYPVAG